jgi:hypothetical protein
METKKIKFGLLYIGSRKLVKFYTNESKHSDEKSVANIMLKRVMIEDGFEFSWEGIKSWLHDYANYMNENMFDDRDDHNAEQLTSYIADNLVYCNAPHIIRLSTSSEVNNEFKDNVMNELEKMFDKALTK